MRQQVAALACLVATSAGLGLDCQAGAGEDGAVCPRGAYREHIALIIGLHSPLEQLAGCDHVGRIQPQPRQPALCIMLSA